MRKSIALMALLLVPSAYAAEGSEMATSAEMRVRFNYQQNPTGNKDARKSQNDWAHRFKLGLTFRSGEKFTGHATLLNNASWGSDSATGNAGNGLNTGTGDAQNMVLVNEVYGTWMVSDEMSLKFGRGSMTMGDGTVIAANDWEATPYAFEGGMANYDMEFMRIMGFAVNFANFNGAAGAQGDDPKAVAYGLNFDIKALPEFLKMANVHLIAGSSDVTTANPGKSSMRYGLSLGGDMSGLDYRVVYNAHTGDQTTGAGVKTDLVGNMYEVELGYSLPDLMGARFHVLYHNDSGTSAGATKNEQYDPYFYELHNNAGLMDVLKWGNLNYIQAGASVKPMDNTTIELRYLMFKAVEKGDTTNFGTGYTLTTDTTKDALGSEIDLSATHQYDNGFAITARYGTFMPGDRLIKAASEKADTISQVFLEGKMTF